MHVFARRERKEEKIFQYRILRKPYGVIREYDTPRESGTRFVGDRNAKSTKIAYDVGEHADAYDCLENWRIVVSYTFQCFLYTLFRFERSPFFHSRVP
jgi:hypothetical protein